MNIIKTVTEKKIIRLEIVAAVLIDLFQKIVRITCSFINRRDFSGILPKIFLISFLSKVKIFPNLIMEGFGKPHFCRSILLKIISSFLIFLGIWDVIANSITSLCVLLNKVEDIISAGLCLTVERSVKGKGTRTILPCL